MKLIVWLWIVYILRYILEKMYMCRNLYLHVPLLVYSSQMMYIYPFLY